MTGPLAAILTAIKQAHPPCLLCGSRSTMTGVFIPGNPQLWGAPAGKQRQVIYPLCHDCADRPDQPDACEQRISESLLGSPQ